MANKICGVILASGSSKRMGENKLLLSVDKKTMVQSVIEACVVSDLYDIVIISCHQEIQQICEKMQVNFLENNHANLGQSQSIKIGVKHFKNADAIMFINADTPRINPEYINDLVHTYNNKILVPYYKGTPMTPVTFPSKYFNDLMDLKGDTGGKSIIKSNNFDKFDSSFKNFDIDTKQDYDKAYGVLNDNIL